MTTNDDVIDTSLMYTIMLMPNQSLQNSNSPSWETPPALPRIFIQLVRYFLTSQRHGRPGCVKIQDKDACSSVNFQCAVVKMDLLGMPRRKPWAKIWCAAQESAVFHEPGCSPYRTAVCGYSRDFNGFWASGTGLVPCRRFICGSYSGSDVTVAWILRPKYSISTVSPSVTVAGSQA